MKKLSNPKIIFVILLVVILFVGMFLLFKTPSSNIKNTGDVGNKGLLSFFGDRKTKPNDETTVPGANSGDINSGGFIDLNGNGINDKDEADSNGDDANGNGQNGDGTGDDNQNNNGSLSIKNIGTSGSNINGSINPSNPNDPQNPNNPYNPNNPNGKLEEPAIQVDCTPKQLVFTAAQQKRLDALNKRFYELAAELKTQQDVENLQRTKENYINYISSDYATNSKKDGSGIVELTKQCFDERAKVNTAKNSNKTTDPFFGKQIGLRPNPFITNKNLDEILVSSPVFRATLLREKRSIEENLIKIKTDIRSINSEIKTIENDLIKLNKDFLEAVRSGDTSKESAAEQSILNKNDELDTLKSDLQRKQEEQIKSEVLLDQIKNDPLSYFANNTSYVDAKDEKINGVPQKRFTDAKQKSNVYQRVQSMFFNSFYCDKNATWIKAGSDNPPEGSAQVWTFDQGDSKPKDQLQRKFINKGNEATHKYDWKRKGWSRVEVSTNVLYYLEEPECEKGYDNGIVRYFWGYGIWSNAKSNPLKDAGYANVYCGPEADKLSDDADPTCSQEYYPMQEIERLLGIW